MKTAFPTVSLVVLLSIGVIDLISTAVLHAHGQITELNPLMNFFISRSEWLFAFVKGLTIGMAWGMLAWYAKQNLAFVNKACWIGSGAYVFIWLTWFFAAR